MLRAITVCLIRPLGRAFSQHKIDDFATFIVMVEQRATVVCTSQLQRLTTSNQPQLTKNFHAYLFKMTKLCCKCFHSHLPCLAVHSVPASADLKSFKAVMASAHVLMRLHIWIDSSTLEHIFSSCVAQTIFP